MPDVLRLGVVGAGRISQVAHLPAATKADGVRLTALCDASSELAHQVASRYGVPAYTDIDEMLEADVDAVLIATPDRSHVSLCQRALRAGKHTLVEKPLAQQSDDALALAETAEREGLVLQVGAMKRHDPGMAFARQAVPRIGGLLSVQAWYRVMSALRPPTEATLFPATVVDQRVRQEEAGFKLDRRRYLLDTHGAHVFDSLRYLAGDLKALRAQVGHVGADLTWHGSGRLSCSDGLASFEISANVHARWSEGFDLYGQDGHISVRSHFPFFRRASSVQVFIEGDMAATTPAFGDSDPYERQLEAFAATVFSGGGANPDGYDGAAAVRLIEAVRLSAAQDGAEVSL